MVSIIEEFGRGFQIGEAIDKANRERKARDAAQAQFGDVALDPGLFAAIQNISNAKTREQVVKDQNRRAEATTRENIAASQQRRRQSEAAFTSQQADAADERTRRASLGVVNALTLARDRGEDLSTAFDNLVPVMESIGASADELSTLRENIVRNPNALEEIRFALDPNARSANPPQQTADERIASILNIPIPERTPAQQALVAKTFGETSPELVKAAEAPVTNESVARLRNQFMSNLDALDRLGAVRTEEPRNVLSRGFRALRSGLIGRNVESAVGTTASGLRASNQAIQTLFLTKIIQDESFSSRMFDSNAEKELWQSAIVDTTAPLETQRRMIDLFVDTFINGGKLTAQDLGEAQRGYTDEELELARRLAADPNAETQSKAWAENLLRRAGE